MPKRIIAVVGIAILSATAALAVPPTPAAANSWSGWFCQWGFTGHPVTGGTLDGRGCANWWTGSALNWLVWADTYAPQSYSIYTSAQGFDRCGLNSYIEQGSTRNTVYNTNYGTSNTSAVLNYQDCQSTGHTYRVRDYSVRQPYSPSDGWEGRDGNVYWGPNP